MWSIYVYKYVYIYKILIFHEYFKDPLYMHKYTNILFLNWQKEKQPRISQDIINQNSSWKNDDNNS